MGFTASGITTATVTTDQQAPLGFVLTVPDSTTSGDSGYGMQEWVYVKASAELAKGNVCGRAVGAITQPFVVGLSVAADTRAGVVGVAQHTIASGSYGFVLRSGVGSVLTDNSITAGCTFTTAADGEVTIFADGEEEKVLGQAFATDAGDQTLVLAAIDCGK